MLVPGANLLNMALTVINPQGVQLQRFTGRVRNAAGMYVNTFAAAVGIVGSFQPVEKKAYVLLGLDLTKEYRTLYTSAAVQVVERGGNGDQITYGGATYQAQSVQDWTGQDGWGAYTFVKVTTP